MIGSEVERGGIIRHGAKMITAVSEATVPQVSVIVRKAYGAGLYAMAGPGFVPDACIALPTAQIAVMGPEAAVNAVYANKIAAIADAGRAGARSSPTGAREYEQDVDLVRLAADLVLDARRRADELREELLPAAALRRQPRPAVRRQAARRPAGLTRQAGRGRRSAAGGCRSGVRAAQVVPRDPELAHQLAQQRQRDARRRCSGRPRCPRRRAPPSPSRVNAPATRSGSPVAT